MTAPISLAEAWSMEMADRGATMQDPGAEGARVLFYAGAVAAMSMVAQVGVDTNDLNEVMRYIHARTDEVSGFLESEEWDDDA